MEDQHGDRVGEPVLLLVLVNAGQGIEPSLEGAKDRREERRLAVEDPGHVPAEGLHEREHEQGKDKDLDPAVEGHDGAPSEPLGAEQGVGEVDEQAQGHETAERVVEEHDAISSEPVARDGVADRESEKGKADGHHDQVEHELEFGHFAGRCRGDQPGLAKPI